ncbi:hypothetical protein MMAD_50320 [Mycolicibacterium madagascariense]|uniref:DUF559 domain-containing protein n=1 Tax=Mycolicibacterium madagascariense TaxID=212765 RepID=A0A7I7XNC7_9MYCO|nr:hypothetical protein [Mycolicibacterium madagascariense]MCV7015601.1 hypothetical protein [Mycolicibacterium madagascariense]BBZ30737.1 hypothetical protein MMAD_50320 [Mycolicibacterium madagascariense]
MRSPVFIGSESGLTPYELARRHQRLLPDVYAPASWTPTLRDRTVAAWLWSKRRAVVAGLAAAALHGADWVDATEPIELIWTCGRPPAGVIVRNETIADDEVTLVAGLPVTTRTRTAFDLGRHLGRGDAVARLDALKRATAFHEADVMALIERYRGARGVRSLRSVLPLVDVGAASPRETWLRLLLVDAGLPQPSSQYRIFDGQSLVKVLDLGWEDYLVGAEYDGDQHRTDRRQYAKDVRVKRQLARLRWNVTYVIKEDRPDEIIRSVRGALLARGWRP